MSRGRINIIPAIHGKLTHLALDGPDAKAKLTIRAELRLPSVLQMQQALRHRLWNQVLDGLAKNKTTRQGVKKLREVIQL